MHNFSHEIPLPDDRAMRKFLWFDYFHDGEIQHIDFDQPARGDVTLTVRSVLDSDILWDKLKGSREEKLAQFEPLLPQATYLLRFHGVKHFRHALTHCIWCKDEILAVRFKDSPLLHRCQADCARPVYHLRADTAHGMMDVVFERFTIRRQEGRVDYRCDWDPAVDEWHELMQQEILPAADDSPDADEYNRDCLRCAQLYRMQQSGDIPGLLALAREILAGDIDPFADPPYYAAHLLGYHGAARDLPALTRLYLHPELPAMPRQITLDAMERIAEREASFLA